MIGLRAPGTLPPPQTVEAAAPIKTEIEKQAQKIGKEA
jgi:hypothetical protein